MSCLPGHPLIRLYLLILLSLFTLVRPAHGEATSSDLQPSTGRPVPVSEAGAENHEGVAGPVSGLGARTADDAHKNMTGFFVIGMIINVLLIVVFLIWAVGQWRKTKK